ncbi:acylneuraminate cytidylyltransferase family protein [Flavobacterium sp. Fl-77]|uniref:Acylneuraminate cytidylyltransferase family protein n=1 Tax=Flavobacterium flavipigmentatum TaxID=2893884 RepID=A0AAJ2S787_9FLAO|nr:MULTISPECIES: acylneuraminate cytidylyltransferase family protein [unclassified Flavobacterium]MDX6182234.1 acylneuraminate cytidylyltransferase family protein [Flavobacterium sp. Fl-33]MDX6185853.1 acylneuraminate cytidylyltransferase family protein [Flavobacterium sp. Fl-77]UFH39032.1 acylneuraminate cytidylyltransferase family protein [Flavobacterium sp. F-70]
MKTIAIIPARGGSKRLPQKNIKLLGGLPLLAHSILFAQANSEIIDEIYVSTDDAAIKKIALEMGVKVMDRPKALSGDLEPTVTALKNVLEQIDDVENVVLLQPTNPLRSENLLREAFDHYLEKKCDSLFTVSQNHQKFGKIEDKKFVPFNYKVGQRSQDLEPLFYENGLLYICKAKLILEDKIISENAFPFVIDTIFAKIDIDTQEDFDYAEYVFDKHIKINS